MHLQIKQPGPGKCPICAMDLVPVYKHSQANLPRNQIELSASAIELAQSRTTPVIRTMPTVEVRMSGKIDYDETRLSEITARFPGRLDRLFVDYNGVAVNKGDHLVEMYSPDLLAAQEELLQAIRTSRDLGGSSSSLLKERAMSTVQSARQKLLLWDLTPEQVAEIERKGQTSDRLTVYAPSSGIVIRKEAVEGKYVETGAPIYTIADLSRVWVQLDAYESDLVWLHFGQDVQFSSEAYPGEVFTGKIAFIDPVLNPKTRTVRVRVNMDNPGGKLKPEMFVTAVVRSQVVSDGKVMNPELAGKWISPMHPEIIRDEPGDCPICGMALVDAESLGYVAASTDSKNLPLVIPASAPLITGKRAVVYLASKEQPGVFEGRVIELGPRAGDQYIVKSGLQEGDLVVSHGAFKIDSAVQILAKPSMMNPSQENESGGNGPGKSFEAPTQFREQLGDVVAAYFAVSDALSRNKFEEAKSSANTLPDLLAVVDMSLLQGEAHMAWMKSLSGLKTGAETLKDASDIAVARAEFDSLSNKLIAAIRAFGLAGDASVYVFHCPMAVDMKGADWLQPEQGIENPYMGQKMVTCGAQTGELKGRGAKGASKSTTPSASQTVHEH